MNNQCKSCNSRNTIIVKDERTFYYRRQPFKIIVNELICKKCGSKEILDSSDTIEQKIYVRYLEKNRDAILSSEQIKFIRINKALSQNEFDKIIGLYPGTTRAAENNKYILNENEIMKIKTWLEK